MICLLSKPLSKSILFLSLFALCTHDASAHKNERGKRPILYVAAEAPIHYHHNVRDYMTLRRIIHFLWNVTKLTAGAIHLAVGINETIKIVQGDSNPVSTMGKTILKRWSSDESRDFGRFLSLVILPYILGPLGITSGWNGIKYM